MSIIGTNTVTQVGFVVRDIEAAKKKWAAFLGVPVPPTVTGGDYAVTKTLVDGKPAPDAGCLLAFFDAGTNFQIELIQPNEAKSTWRDFLDTHGEGIHHLGFHQKDTEKHIAECEKFGLKCAQRGGYGDGGGQYVYIDAEKDLKCFVELLENYK